MFPNPGGIRLFVANADGSGEHPRLAKPSTDYGPTWSADGAWLAFTSEREGSADIYRVRPDGTQLERLTDSPAFDDQAAFSPDGRRIVFVSTRGGGTADLWTLDVETRRARPLTSGPGGDFRPAWSPDGQWIAFSSDRGAGLPPANGRWEALHLVDVYLIRPDGSGLRRLTWERGFCGSPRWSADSARVVASCMSGQDTLAFRRPVVDEGTTRLVSIDTVTGALTDVSSGPGHYSDGTRGPAGTVLGAAWSPDGTRVAFHRADPIGPPALVEVWSRRSDFALRLSGVLPSSSPDGAAIAMATFVPPPGHNSLLVVRTGAPPTEVFHDERRNVLGPQWTPKGRCHSLRARPVRRFLQRFPRAVPAAGGSRERWCAASDCPGRWLRVPGVDERRQQRRVPIHEPGRPPHRLSQLRAGGEGLRILDVETKAVSRLTSAYDNFPLWSPRGDLIMFSRLEKGDYEIFTIRPDGRGLKRLTRASGNDAHQGWSPDGEHIVFASSRLGFKDEAPYTNAPQPYGELFVMRYDGTGLQQLTDNQWEDGGPAWLAVPR